MLLTLPILFAIWAVLQVSIELRGAPCFGWIHDLSAPDPFYVMPVLMGVTQFWQQRMTPMTGADPAQQKMMMFMPLVMGFIFFSLPAGALLYYVASTVFGIGQQYLTNRIIGPPNVRTPRPAGRAAGETGRRRQDRRRIGEHEVMTDNDVTPRIVEFLERFSAALGVGRHGEGRRARRRPAAQS